MEPFFQDGTGNSPGMSSSDDEGRSTPVGRCSLAVSNPVLEAPGVQIVSMKPVFKPPKPVFKPPGGAG
jgi:hypothetical protein